MNHTELVRWNKLGLIPGPAESEEAFLERVKFCLNLRNELKDELLPPDRKDASFDILAAPFKISEENFDVRPEWVPLFFSNWKLLPWHGGSAWIFQCEKDGPLGAVLQLRKAFFSKTRYLGLYERGELIAHEMAHAARMAFDEKEYEEIFAYKTSKQGISRTFGPILQSSVESKWFVFLLATLLLLDLFLIFMGSWEAYFSFQPLKAIPLLLVVYGAYRLNKKKQTLKKTEVILSSLVGKMNAPFVLFRLKDNEIKQFSTFSPQQVLSYFQSENSPRIQMIRAAYFS